MHYSRENTSSKPRHAYTVHFVESSALMVNIDGARRIGSFAQRTIHSFLCDAHLFFRLVYFPLMCVCVKRIDACVMRVCVLQPRVSLLFSSLLISPHCSLR